MMRPYAPVPGSPAFLDALDEIRLWLAEPAQPLDLAGKFRVQVGVHALAVVGVQGGEKAAPVRDPGVVVLAGTLQKALGGSAWNPPGARPG